MCLKGPLELQQRTSSTLRHTCAGWGCLECCWVATRMTPGDKERRVLTVCVRYSSVRVAVQHPQAGCICISCRNKYNTLCFGVLIFEWQLGWFGFVLSSATLLVNHGCLSEAHVPPGTWQPGKAVQAVLVLSCLES